MRRSLSLSLSLVWCVADLPGQPPPEPDVCVVGAWDPPFTHLDVGTTNPGGFVNKPNVNLQGPNHKFNALHMALIPTPGSRRGKVVVWDLHYPSTPAPDPATQRWSIVDPVAKTMENYDFTLPSGKGDLFCAGHGWTKDGKLFVVGGTEAYPQNGGYLGGKLAYIWDPDPTRTMNTGWVKQFDPKVNRWYPTVTMDDNNKLIVTGGLHHQITNPSTNFFNNDFEVFAVGAINPLTGTWESNNGVFVWQGPDMTKASKFTTYPRFHLLSTGEIFMSGHGPRIGSENPNSQHTIHGDSL